MIVIVASIEYLANVIVIRKYPDVFILACFRHLKLSKAKGPYPATGIEVMTP